MNCSIPITRPRTSAEVSTWIMVVASGQTIPTPVTPTSVKNTKVAQNQLDQANKVSTAVKTNRLSSKAR